MPPDGDSDGLSDRMEGARGADPEAPDSDAEGCLGGAEFSPEEEEGGRRDPATFWDFVDVPASSAPDRDGTVSVGDIWATVLRFGAGDAGAGRLGRA